MIVPLPAGLGPGEPLGPEGYRLTRRDGDVTIEAETDAGRFYAERTLDALAPGDVELADRPRFGWRGFMLDVARHPFTVEEICRVVDHLAELKLNRLHLHLSDDHGWRIEIKGRPRLTEVGAASAVGGDPGGFLTQDDLGEVVRYAAERFVTVVPELDMPAHVQAALVSYPELGAPGSSEEPCTTYGKGFASSFDVHSDAVYAFVEEVLGELAAITPGEYLHIGADEAWNTTHEDYLVFMERVQPIVAATGKRLVCWEEGAGAPLADGSIVQYWNPGGGHAAGGLEPKIVEAAERGAGVILSPANRVYLDMKYDAQTELGLTWAGLVELRDSYDWEPTDAIPDLAEASILGVEAALWTETVRTFEDLETMLLPRLAAAAEVAWSPAGSRDWDGFRGRVAAAAARWQAAGVAFHRSAGVDWPD